MPKNRIKEMRKEVGLSQKELGERLGVGQPTVSAWETGRNHPDNATLYELSKIMGCSIGYLMGYETDVPYRGLSQKEWDEWIVQRYNPTDEKKGQEQTSQHTAELNDIFEHLTEEEKKRAVEVIRLMFQPGNNG